MNQAADHESCNNHSNNKTVIVIDNANNTIIRDQIEFKLEPLMLRLLAYFCANQQQIISRQQLIEQVWRSNYTSDTAINRSISELRKALGGSRNSIIKTLPKTGYSFTVPENVIFEQLTISETVPSVDIKKKEGVEAKPITNQANNPLIAPPATNNRSTVTTANKILMVFVGFVIMFILASQLMPTDSHTNHSDDRLPVEKPGITLSIAPFEHVNTKHLNQTFKQALQAQITNKALKIKDINIINPANEQQTQANFTLKGILGEFDHHLSLTIQLIDNQRQQLRYSTAFTRPLDDLTQTTQDLSAEIAAIIRLWLLNKALADNYINALTPLTHQDIAKMVEVRKNINTKTPNSLLHAQKTLTELNEKYPDTAEILGLLSTLEWYKDSTQLIINSNLPLQLHYGNAALTLDPKNFDALNSLFYYHINRAHLREKAHKFADNLLRYHPDEKLSWRAKLYLLIDTVTPCKDIRQFIEYAPKDIFNPSRQQVIIQILDHCQFLTPLPKLIDNNNNLPANVARNKAVYRNLYLFKLRNDESIEVINRKLRASTSSARLMEKMNIQYMLEDTAGAYNTFTTINTKYDYPWQQMAGLFRDFYQSGAQDNTFEFNQIIYNYLYASVDLTLAAHLVKQVNTNKQSPALLNQYLNKRPKFKVTLQNRYETLALMMVQHANGNQAQSQSTANRLYLQLEQFRTQNPASFRFWSLGRYHLAARLYCGEACQTLTDEHYLSDIFAPTHTWWLDNLTLMTQVLEPFKQKPLVIDYLNRLEQDQTRIKLKMGL